MEKEKRRSCPNCGSIRIVGKIDKDRQYYKCNKCGWIGDVTKEVIWLFGTSYNGGKIPIGSASISSVRDRPYCPKCYSIRLRRRVHTHDYYCENCKWVGESPKKMKWGSAEICQIK